MTYPVIAEVIAKYSVNDTREHSLIVEGIKEGKEVTQV